MCLPFATTIPLLPIEQAMSLTFVAVLTFFAAQFLDSDAFLVSSSIPVSPQT